MMGECIQNSAIVQNEMELYLTVAKFKKPVKIKPLAPNAGPERILDEMECRALISPPGASQCQCCVGEFFPSYPFVVEEVWLGNNYCKGVEIKMRYRIDGQDLPVVICELDSGESVFTESGGMAWMSENIRMETNMEGGFLGGLMRGLSGESFFMCTYTCTGREKGEIAFASSYPGSIVDLDLSHGESIICQKTAFLFAERNVKLEMYFKKRLGTGLFGGEGFILQKLTGPGRAFLEFDGSIIKKELAAGERILVDTGHVGAFTPSVKFDITTVKGFKNVLFGGEGLFLTELQGPGTVYLQTMPIENVAKRIIPFLPIEKR